MKRTNECAVCGKDRCSEKYCFRMQKKIYQNKNGASWEGKKVNGLGRVSKKKKTSQSNQNFDFGQNFGENLGKI